MDVYGVSGTASQRVTISAMTLVSSLREPEVRYFSEKHPILAFWVGYFAGVISFFIVLGLIAYFAERLLPGAWRDQRRLGDIASLVMFCVASVAGAYVCARINKVTPLFACLCFGGVGGIFSFIGIGMAVYTPDWYFFLRGLLVLCGALIGYALANRVNQF